MWARSQRMKRTVLCVALMTARPMKFVACAMGCPSRLRRVPPRWIPFFLSTASSSPSSFTPPSRFWRQLLASKKMGSLIFMSLFFPAKGVDLCVQVIPRNLYARVK